MSGCEILVWVKDCPDPKNTGFMPKQGDVEAVNPSGFFWGYVEIGGYAWGDIPADLQAYPDAVLPVGTRYRVRPFSDGRSLATDLKTGATQIVFDPASVSVPGPESIDTVPNGRRPWFRVIKFTNVPVLTAQVMMNPLYGPADPITGIKPHLAYRAQYIDRTKISGALLAHWIDDLRTSQFLSLPYTPAQINQVISTRVVGG